MVNIWSIVIRNLIYTKTGIISHKQILKSVQFRTGNAHMIPAVPLAIHTLLYAPQPVLSWNLAKKHGRKPRPASQAFGATFSLIHF